MEKENIYEDIAMIFSSCVQYKGIWDGFFKLFKKFAPFINCKIYGTTPDNYFYEDLCIVGNQYRGNDTSFSTRLIKTLKKVKERYVLFFLDDFFLTDYINQHYIENAISLIKSNNIDNIMLKGFVDQNVKGHFAYNDLFVRVDKYAPYKCTTQVGLFKTKYLLSLLRKGESAWDFELIGTYRAHRNNKIILYRTNQCDHYISYYSAGLLHRGVIQDIYKDVLVENDIIITPPISTSEKNIKKIKRGGVAKKIFRTYDFYYPKLSIYLKFLRKRKGGTIPNYVNE